jgi:RHS repeat-associated protein
MVRIAIVLSLAIAPVLLGEEPQAVAALEHLKPKAEVGPVSWTNGPYQYDGMGNITSIGNEVFVYDKVGRLKSGTVRGPDLTSLQTQTFSHDVYGNLTGTSKLGQTVTLSVDASTNHLVDAGYDASGNVVSSGSRRYHYDALGMLNTVSVGSDVKPRIVYAYTADDERLFAFDVAANTTHWTLRGLDNKVLRDFKQEGGVWSVERDYVYRDGFLLAAIKSAGAVEHYTLDHLGTPRLITDGAGNKIGYHAYWPFGEEWTSGNVQEGLALKFTGHERDADPTGGAVPLDYMHARYYQAAWGRFTTVDPGGALDLDDPQSWNLYTYARNNPLLRVDRDGRYGVIVFVEAAVVVVAAAVVIRYEMFLREQNRHDPSRTNRQVAADNIREARASLSTRLQRMRGGNIAKSEANKTVDEVLKHTTPGRETRSGNRVTQQHDAAGGTNQAVRDFHDVVVPGSVEAKGDGVLVGRTPDGRTVVVRPTSTDGRPTVEVQDGKDKKTKIRYSGQDESTGEDKQQ